MPSHELYQVVVQYVSSTGELKEEQAEIAILWDAAQSIRKYITGVTGLGGVDHAYIVGAYVVPLEGESINEPGRRVLGAARQDST